MEESETMQGARILLVEDDAVIADLLRRNLQARGHEVSMAVDAQQALKHLRTASFDLILLDINLPDQTGWEVLRTANKEGSLTPLEMYGQDKLLPVVVLSAVRISPRRLQEFHPLAYLPKPFPMEAILRLAKEAVGRRYGEPVNTEEEDEAGAESSRNAISDEEDLYA